MYAQDVIKSVLDRFVDDDSDDRVTNAQLARQIAVELAMAGKLSEDGFAETRAQLDELAQQAEGSHRQHIETGINQNRGTSIRWRA